MYTAQALEELFSFLTGIPSGAPAALAGLVDAQAAAEEPPRVAVVVASAAEATSPAVQSQLEALTAAAGSHAKLPNAAHEVRTRGAGTAAAALLPSTLRLTPLWVFAAQGPSHPVFGGLRRCTRRARVRVLGRCSGSTPSAGAATRASLRAELEAARDAEQPTIVVLCPPPAPAPTEEGPPADPEADLLAAAAALLKELAPERHLLVHAVHAASAAQRAQHEARRRLLTAAAVRGDAANRTSNYTVCDATCHKHVSPDAPLHAAAGRASLRRDGGCPARAAPMPSSALLFATPPPRQPKRHKEASCPATCSQQPAPLPLLTPRCSHPTHPTATMRRSCGSRA